MRHSGTPPGRYSSGSRSGSDPGGRGWISLGGRIRRGWIRLGGWPRLGTAGLAAVIVSGVAGCEAPPEARFPISERGAALPRPELGETARFGRIAADSAATAQGIDAERAALAARAAGLRARAAELSGPIIADEDLERLTTARDDGIAPPPPLPGSPSEPPSD